MSDLSNFENDLRSLLTKVYNEGYRRGFEDHEEIVADMGHDIESIKFITPAEKEDNENGNS